MNGPSQHPAQGAPRVSATRMAVTSLVGTAIEWYDFTIYGTTAALVFAPQFFPNASPLAGTLAAFATFGVGFLARPVGGILMGHYGDRIGRKVTLVTSLLLVGAATFLVGILPTYATIGVAAPIMLVLLRFVQGIGVGGEWGGAVLLGAEHAPKGRRTFFGSFAQLGLPLGVAVAALTFVLLTSVMGMATFVAWGWRIPFLLSAVLVILGLWARLKITETRDFQKALDSKSTHAVPISALVRKAPLSTVLSGIASAASPAIGILMFSYMVTYAGEQLGVAPTAVLYAIAVMAVSWMPTILITASLSDKIGRKPIFMLGLLAIALWMVPFFELVNTANSWNIALAYFVAGIPIGMMTGPQAGLLADLFAPEVRYTGISMAYQIGSVLGGGLSPIIAALLVDRTGGSLAVATYLILMCLGSLAALAFLIDPRDATEQEAEQVTNPSQAVPVTA